MAPPLTSESSSLQQLRLLSSRVAYIVAPVIDSLFLTALQRGQELAAQEAMKELTRRGLRLSRHALSR
jgi:hypothetical protein